LMLEAFLREAMPLLVRCGSMTPHLMCGGKPRGRRA